ncbi:MAG: methyltransferase domain-containing protein [Candidatus Sericytochromatia bacterium]
MKKILSLLKFQLKVLSAYFRNPRWNVAKLKEFLVYLAYYFMNLCYSSIIILYENNWLKKYPKLLSVDQKMTDSYADSNQFWVSLVASYKQKTEKLHNLTYGETTYFSIYQSLKFIELNEKDVFYDLGCGTGKTVFTANTIFGANSTGIELIADFVDNANQISKELDLKNIKFLEKSIFEHNLKDGTVFYVTPTCFDPDNMKKLEEKFKTLPKNARVIILSKRMDLPNFKFLGQKELYYSWGKAHTFYYQVV